MTGYGRAQQILNGRDILVEIRSVNHRYYEYSSRVPRTYSYIDEKLKALLKNGISRGKVEVSVTINNIEGKDTEIAINKGAAEGYVNALRSIADELGVEDDITLSKLMKLPVIIMGRSSCGKDSIYKKLPMTRNRSGRTLPQLPPRLSDASWRCARSRASVSKRI